jgi:uncharacterized membrane protein
MSHRDQKGVVAIELAIVLVPLTILLFGMLELGRAFYQYDTIVKSTRNAARYLSVQVPGVGIPEAKCIVVSGTISADTCPSPLLSSLNAAMVTVRYIDGVSTCPVGAVKGCGAINLVEVCVNCSETAEKFQFVSLAKLFVPDLAFGEIRAVMRREGA